MELFSIRIQRTFQLVSTTNILIIKQLEKNTNFIPRLIVKNKV